MGFTFFAEGPLLQLVFILFGLGIATRFIFFIQAVVWSSEKKEARRGYIPAILVRFLVPFHRAMIKRPVYAGLRYLFHFCLFLVPIWYSGHIVLWTDSRYELEWGPMPDGLADAMTLLLLGLVCFFLGRHLLVNRIRTSTSGFDYLLVLVVALAFGSGYALTHGTLDHIAFFSDNIYLLHILSAEAMLLITVVLFCRTRLDERRCIGCASCEVSCPTGTIETEDEGLARRFLYGHYQCICCGSCVNVCPEEAAELRHEISLKRLFQVRRKELIQLVELQPCQRCGAAIVPTPQHNKVTQTFSDDYLAFCPKCRKITTAEALRSASAMAPWFPAAHEKSDRSNEAQAKVLKGVENGDR